MPYASAAAAVPAVDRTSEIAATPPGPNLRPIAGSSKLTKPAGLDQFETRAHLRLAAGLAALQPTEAAYDNLVASLRETAALLRAHRESVASRRAGRSNAA